LDGKVRLYFSATVVKETKWVATKKNSDVLTQHWVVFGFNNTLKRGTRMCCLLLFVVLGTESGAFFSFWPSTVSLFLFVMDFQSERFWKPASTSQYHFKRSMILFAFSPYLLLYMGSQFKFIHQLLNHVFLFLLDMQFKIMFGLNYFREKLNEA